MQAALGFGGCREATSAADSLRQRVTEQDAQLAAIGHTPRSSDSAISAQSTPYASVVSSQAQLSREQQDAHSDKPYAAGHPPEQQRIERAASTNPLFVPRPDRDASSQPNAEQLALIDHLRRQVAELQQHKECTVQSAATSNSPLDTPSPAPHGETSAQPSPATTAALSEADPRNTMPVALQQQTSLSTAASIIPPTTKDAACNTTSTVNCQTDPNPSPTPVGCQTDPKDSASPRDIKPMFAVAEPDQMVAYPPAAYPTQSHHLQPSKRKSSADRSNSNSGTSSEEGAHHKRISKWKARCRQLRKALTESHETIAAASAAQAGSPASYHLKT